MFRGLPLTVKFIVVLEIICLIWMGSIFMTKYYVLKTDLNVVSVEPVSHKAKDALIKGHKSNNLTKKKIKFWAQGKKITLFQKEDGGGAVAAAASSKLFDALFSFDHCQFDDGSALVNENRKFNIKKINNNSFYHRDYILEIKGMYRTSKIDIIDDSDYVYPFDKIRTLEGTYVLDGDVDDFSALFSKQKFKITVLPKVKGYRPGRIFYKMFQAEIVVKVLCFAMVLGLIAIDIAINRSKRYFRTIA